MFICVAVDCTKSNTRQMEGLNFTNFHGKKIGSSNDL